MATLEEIARCLEVGENVVRALQDLNTLLEADPSSSYSLQVAEKVSLPMLFGFLQSTKQDQIRCACSVLDKLFSSFPPALLVEYGGYIELGLQYTMEEVKKMCVRVLTKHCSDPAVSAMICSPTLFHLLTLVVGEESLECAKMASGLLLKFLVRPGDLSDQVKESFLLDAQMLLGASDTVRYRMFELAVQVFLQEGAGFVKESEILEKLVCELELEDILVKLNAIELLTQLLESSDGCKFLESQEVLSKLHSLLISAQQDPFGSVVIPGLLKFFGHSSLVEGTDLPAVCSQYPGFLQLVFQAVHNPHEPTLWGVAVDTFGVLGSSVRGREILLHSASQTDDALTAIGGMVVSGASDIRIRALRAVAMLLSCEEEAGKWEESTSRQWFGKMHHRMFSTIMSIVRQPFLDLRLAGLRVLVAMAPFEWAQREMTSNPGFLEYLVDRKTETTKEGKELKYDIIHSIVGSGCAENVFEGSEQIKLRKYDREGPFFYTADTTVAFEGST